MTPTYKPASVQIKVINSGFLDDELGQALSEATRKVLEHGKNATITHWQSLPALPTTNPAM